MYPCIDDYNHGKRRKITIVFDDMITEKLPPRVTELFVRGRKLTVVFITQSYFRVPNDIQLNATHYFIMKIPNKRDLQQIAYNHSGDIDFRDFKELYKKCTEGPHDFMVIDMILPHEDPWRFRKNLIEKI